MKIDVKFQETNQSFVADFREVHQVSDGGYDRGYTKGYDKGLSDGYKTGQAEGYDTGRTDGYNEGRTDGYSEGYNTGNTEGYESGYDKGNTDGYENGYGKGHTDGYDKGRTDGHADGYAEGYEDGFSHVKEEQEKTVEITENGTTDILPDDGKVLSKVTVNVEVPSSGGEELAVLETKIDESGVLDGTEQNLDEKVDGLIDYTGFIKTAYANGKAIYFGGATWLIEVPELDFSKVTSFASLFSGCTSLVRLPELDASSCSTLNNFMNGTNKLQRLVLKNTSSKITNWGNAFRHCGSLQSITPALDVSGAPNFGQTFQNCAALVDISFVKGSIYKELTIPSGVLSDESIQSIIDGLADLTGSTQQTLTLNATVSAKLTEQQIATITSKNWVVA